MTRIPNRDSPTSDGLTSIDNLLQTHNDLILAIHKSFTDSYNNINRTINNLTEEVRQVKTYVQQVASDRVLQDELTAWRSHTEQVLRTQEDRHRRDVDLLVDLFKKGAASIQSAPPAAPQVQPNQFYNPMQQHLVLEAQKAMSNQHGYVDPLQQLQYLQQMDFLNKHHRQLTNAMSAAPPTLVSTPATASAAPSVVPNQNKTNTVAPFGTTAPLFGSTTAPSVVPNQNKANTVAPIGTTAPLFGTITQVTTKPSVITPVPVVKSEYREKPSILTPKSSAPSTPSALPKLSEQFKPKPGSWNCPNCMINNEAHVNVCNCCKASRDGKTQAAPPSNATFGKPATTEAAKAFPDFKFGFSSGLASSSGFAALANNASQAGSGFLMSSSPSNKASFGDPKNYQLFSQQKATIPEQPSEDTKKKGDESDNEAEEFVPDAHYEPVVPLPALVEAKTGEEDEEIMFVARCKLYRFDKETKANKERGVGEIKVLHNSKTDRYRCVMRRDQVLKVCANFPIHANFKITPKPHTPTAFYWSCKDYSEDANGTDEVLCARFKDAAIAEEFAKIVAQAASQAGKDSKPAQQSQSGASVTQQSFNFGFGLQTGSSNAMAVSDRVEQGNNIDNKSAVDKE